MHLKNYFQEKSLMYDSYRISYFFKALINKIITLFGKNDDNFFIKEIAIFNEIDPTT